MITAIDSGIGSIIIRTDKPREFRRAMCAPLLHDDTLQLRHMRTRARTVSHSVTDDAVNEQVLRKYSSS